MEAKTSKILKIIFVSLAAVCVAGYLVFSALSTYNLPETKVTTIRVDILDQEKYSFISNEDVYAKLAGEKLNPIGKKASPKLADSVEKTINSISFVKKSECYIGNNGVMTIELTQRQPMFLVKSSGSADFYIDSERKRMPVSPNHTAFQLVASGNISETRAKNEVYELVEYLLKDNLYKDLVSQVYVDKNNAYYLGTRQGVPTIKLGSFENYNTKLEKLRAWYNQYPGFAWSSKYIMVDASYKGLIYCTKAETKP